MKKFCKYVAMVMVLIACSKTNEETESLRTTPPVVTPNACDTVNMKYTTNVLPILQASCYSCHGNGRASGGISLGSYSAVKQQVTNTNLLNAITHAPNYVPMPYNQPKLSDCDINKIRDWIERGSLNN